MGAPLSTYSVYFRIVYCDGDEEDVTYAELKRILTTRGVAPAVSAASIPAELESETDESVPPHYSFDETTEQHLQDYVALATIASEQALGGAGLPTAQKPDKHLPYGEVYNWHKVFRMTADEKAKHVVAMQKEIDKLTSAGHARWEHLPSPSRGDCYSQCRCLSS